MTQLARALAIACLALLGAANAAYAVDVSALKPFPCPDDYGQIGSTVLRHCGHLRTSEQPGGIGRPIDLAVVVVIPADAEAAKRPPTVFVHGGPGGEVVSDWASIASLPVGQVAPMIIFDQRAVGLSTPKLCEFLDKDDPELDDDDVETLRMRALADAHKCVNELAAAGVHLSSYGTHATVRDMETLRAALKIDIWNVYGISYGTTVTLAYLAAHEQRVNTAVIDSVYPPEMPGFTSTLTDFLKTLDAMNTLCAKQADCRASFGDVRTALDEAIHALKDNPLPVETWNVNKSAYETRNLSDSALVNIVMGKSMWIAYWPYVPRLIADARARRATPLVAAAVGDLLYESAFRNNGAFLATECFERAPFDDKRRLDAAAAQWPDIARTVAVDTNLDACALWPAKQQQQTQTPLSVQRPVLVLAGEWDPATPPEQARRTARSLGVYAKLVVVPKATHSVSIGDTCVENMVSAFVADPYAPRDTACIDARRDPVIATRLIAVDEAAAYDVDALPASSYVFLVAIVSSLIWPLAWLIGRPARSPAPWRRSPLWLTVASIGVLAWAYPLVKAALGARDAALNWLRYGIPAEVWPSFPGVLLLAGATAVGFALLLREHKQLSVWQLFHRWFILAGLAAVFISLWQLGLLAEAPPHALAALRAITGL